MRKFVCLLFLITLTIVNCASDSFTEELLLKPLYNEQVYAHFHFSTKWDTNVDTEKCKYLYKMFFSTYK